jgi:hypothetical protein
MLGCSSAAALEVKTLVGCEAEAGDRELVDVQREGQHTLRTPIPRSLAAARPRDRLHVARR